MRNLLRRTGTDTRYLLIAFPLATIGFVLAVAGFAAGVGTAVVVVGLPVLSVTLAVARGFAGIERARLPEVLGYPIAAPRYRRPPAGAGPFRTVVDRLACGQSWLDLLYAVVRFPIAVASFVIVVVWWAVMLLGLTYPLYGWILDRTPAGSDELVEILGLGSGLGTATLFYLAIAAVFAITLPFVVRGVALLNAGLGQAMLAPVVDLSGGAGHPGAVSGPATGAAPHGPLLAESAAYSAR